MDNEKKGIIAAIFSVLLALRTWYVMFGIDKLKFSINELSSELANDYLIGEIIPIDIGVVVCGIIGILLGRYAKKNSQRWRWLGTCGMVSAIISIIVSFTPIATFLPVIPYSILSTFDMGSELLANADEYEEFSKYIDMSEYLVIIEDHENVDVKEIIESRVREVENEKVESIKVEKIRSYVEIKLKIKDEKGKGDTIEYRLPIKYMNYQDAYYEVQEKGTVAYMNGNILYGQELDFSNQFMFYNYKINYPLMMDMSKCMDGLQLSAYAKGIDATLQNGYGYYEFRIYCASTAEYSWLSPVELDELPKKDNLAAMPDACKVLIRHATFYDVPTSGEQTINSSETIDVNGMQMQKVRGEIGEDKMYSYVAYYFPIEQDGISYPAVLLGVSGHIAKDDMENYLEQVVNHIEKVQ